jgi:two-component system, OmpR family, heavy metal sensor histidine kinase CusS
MFLRKLYKNWTIKGRLAFLIILTALAISFARYRIIHETLHTSLSKAEEEFVYDRLHTIRAIIKNKPDYLNIIRNDIAWEREYVPFPEYFIRFIDASGRVVLETPGMGDLLPQQWFPAPQERQKATFFHEDMNIQANNGRSYILMTDADNTPSGSNKELKIQVALDVTSPTKIDETNHKNVIAILFIESLIFAGISILIIRKVLHPLEEMVNISDQITVENIAERIDPNNWPKEVQSLALSFNSMLDRLENAFTRLSQCTSTIAHEIRTPINNCMGEAEIALSRDRTPEEYKKVLASGLEECERLSRLINSLLFLAHADNPTGSINRTLFDPLVEVKNILSFYEPKIEEKGAELTCCGNGQLNGDPLLFRQAVSNILNNALNYSPDGIKISISIRETEDRHLEMIVSDTGHGMEEGDLARIFDRFYRVDRTHSSHPEGSGLGLSIVRAIMDLHGGSVSIVSSPGEGTSVTLRFPIGVLPPRTQEKI